MTSMNNGIITVDRSIAPNFKEIPGFKEIQKPLNKEWETHGPTEFSLSDIDPWIHPNQKVGGEFGFEIWEDLKRSGEIIYHFNTADGLAIQSQGYEFYCQFFWPGFVLPFWKSVWQHNSGLYVTCMYGDDKKNVVIGNKWLCDRFTLRNPAPRLRAKQIQ